MGWFRSIPRKFGKLMLFVAIFTFIIFLIDLSHTEKTDQPAKVTGFVVNNIIPTEVHWIVKAVNIVTNPWLLVTAVLVILWLFGYFTKRR